jgi:hypothetical protein
MSDASLLSSIAQFKEPREGIPWPAPRAIERLLLDCAEQLFTQCRADFRRWLSESDLQSLLYTIVRRELPAHGIASCAVHTGYPIKLPEEVIKRLKKRGKLLPVDLVLVVPGTIHLLRGRRWEAQLAAVIEVKRGCERYREVRADLDKLAAIREHYPDVLPSMVLMGFRNSQEDLAAISHTAADLDIPLLYDNYWSRDERIDQNELI